MAAPKAALLFLLVVVLVSGGSEAHAHGPAQGPTHAPAPGPVSPHLHIARILSRYKEFRVFSSLLSQTGLARAIDARKVVTVLAPNNTALPAAVRRLPRPLLADLLSLHVVLDHLDPAKLDALRRGTAGNGSVVPTLLKGDGTTRGIRIAGDNHGRVTFSYAGPGGRGSRNNATLIRVVTDEAHSLLVLQVSGLVIPAAVPATTAAPVDITKILSSYSEFSVFSSLLSETGLTKAINARKVVTVLAANNSAISSTVRNLPRPLLAGLLKLHVVLDYLDPARLDALRSGTTGNGSVITTLLNGTSVTRGLRVVGDKDGGITFSYGGPSSLGSQNSATLVRVVTAQAYSVLVLEVSGLVIPAAVPASTSTPFDITTILSSYPEFSIFSSLLNGTGLMKAINSQKAVTVLAPNNTALPSAVRRLPRPLLADLLSLHVVLDHLDPAKLDVLRRGTSGNGSVVPTLLKGTGILVAGQNDSCIHFSYAGPGGRGSRNKATLVKVVTDQAQSLVVLQVSGLVIPAAVPAITAAPFDIAKILSGYPEFSNFGSLLKDLNLTKAINARKVVTILAPNNTALSAAIRSLPPSQLPQVLEVFSLHVVLDFLNPERLDALRRSKTSDGSMVTTLFQANRRGGTMRRRGVGFLRVTGGDDGRITFSSAAPGGTRNATLVKVVTSQGFSVMLLQVSGLIVPPAIDKPQQPKARHMSLAPSRAPAPALAPQHPPVSTSGPLVPSPSMPVSALNLTAGTAASPPFVVLPIPSVHGGVAAKLSSAAGHRAGSWWINGAGAALGIMACLLGRL